MDAWSRSSSVISVSRCGLVYPTPSWSSTHGEHNSPASAFQKERLFLFYKQIDKTSQLSWLESEPHTQSPSPHKSSLCGPDIPSGHGMSVRTPPITTCHLASPLSEESAVLADTPCPSQGTGFMCPKPSSTSPTALSGLSLHS